jgi:hypothetical protein
LGWLALIVVPYFLVVADYQVWWGAWCPPARYLAPVTPLLALPLAVALAKARQRVVFRGLYVLLAGLGVASMVAMLAHLDYQTADHVNMLFNLTTGEAAFFSWLQARTGVNLNPLFPALAPRFVWMDFAFSWREVAPALGLMATWLGAGLLCLLGKQPTAKGALRSTPE